MIDNVGFSLKGWNEYTEWQAEDKRTLKKINQLIRDIVRNGNEGLGHPEPLKGNKLCMNVVEPPVAKSNSLERRSATLFSFRICLQLSSRIFIAIRL
jgi:hypothetical protein